MRYYPVPFSSKGEDRLFFNLTIQESLIIGAGICVGVLAAKVVSVFSGALVTICLPVAIPFAVAGILFVVVPIRHVDGQISLFHYCVRKIEFNRKPRHFLRGFFK